MNSYFIHSNGNYFSCNIGTVVYIAWCNADGEYQSSGCMYSVKDFVNKFVNDSMIVNTTRKPQFTGKIMGVSIDYSISTEESKSMLISEIEISQKKIQIAQDIEKKILELIETFDISGLSDIDITVNISQIGIRSSVINGQGYDITNPKF